MKPRPYFSTLHRATGPSAVALSLESRTPADMLRWLCVPLVALAVLLMTIDIADAKRLGGNKSFGSKDTYSKSYDKPVPPGSNPSNMNRQATPNQPGAAPGGFLSRFGGIGGMLGGLLVGGMIGSLLFGGMGGGVGIIEILLLCVAGYLLFRFIRSRRAAQAGQGGQATRMERAEPAGGDRFAYASGPAGGYAPGPDADGWDNVRQTPAGSGGAAEVSRPAMPAGLDESEFLSGAKTIYARLQASWDRRDLADIRTFTSPEVHAEIARQAEEDPTPGKTDVLKVEARVVDAGKDGTNTVISVLYDVLLREDRNASQPSQVREVWHFRRDESAAKPEWILEGIQQLDM